MNDLKSRWGLLRSELIYLWKPFSRRRLRRFYSRFVQPGALCFDIGAHLGSRSRAFLLAVHLSSVLDSAAMRL